MDDWPKFVEGINRQAHIVSAGRPVIIKDPDAPLVILTLAEFEHYRWLMDQQRHVSASDARRAANRAFLRDLVGTQVGNGPLVWATDPLPHWKVPFHHTDGTLITTIDVDAKTGEAQLSEVERAQLFDQLEEYIWRKRAGKFPFIVWIKLWQRQLKRALKLEKPGY